MAGTLILALLVPTLALGQAPGRVNGRLSDAATGTAIEGAMVRLTGTPLGAVSGADGRYLILRVPPGQYTIRTAYLGRQPATREIEVQAGRETTVDLELSTVVLQEVVIDGVRAQGQAEALTRQMNADNIVSIVASDQMGRFPDASAPDAVQRLPGVAVERDLGEGRYIQIRGGSPQNTQVTFNGEQVPSPEGDSRQIALDAVPADVLESIEVAKAITPDMDAEAIGGSVNLVTRRAPDTRYLRFESAVAYGSIREAYSGSGSATLGDRVAGGRLGYLFSGSFSRRDFGADGVEPSYDIGDAGANDDVLEELEVRYYTLYRARTGAVGTIDYRLDPNSSLFVTGVYSHLQDEEQRRRLVSVIEDGELEFAHKFRRENLRMLNLTGGGEHLLGSGFGIDYHLTVARSEEDTPFDTELAFIREGVSFAPSLADPDRPQTNPAGGVDGDYLFDALEPASSQTSNRDITAALNVSRAYRAGSGSGTLRFGGKIRQKRKTRDVFERGFELAGGAADVMLDDVGGPFAIDGFNPGFYALPGRVTSGGTVRGFLQRFNGSLDGEDVIEADAEDYRLRERTAAGYVMTQHQLGEQLLLVPGVRYEHTWFEGDAFEWDSEAETLTPAARDNDYGNLFPMLHARWRAAERTNVRAAFTTAIARPNFFHQVPYRVRDDEDLAIGNPDLEPTTSRNFDLMVERYDPRIGVLSAGLFLKRLENPIFLFTEDNTLGGETTQPRNGRSGTIRGIELAVQQQLRFLPGAFSGLGVFANYTLTDSEARLPGGLETRLPGQAKHVANGAISYERGRFSGQVSLNYQDDYVLELGGDEGGAEEREEDLVVAGHSRLDLAASFFVTARAQLFLDAVNLTNEPYVTYQSIPSRPRQREFYEPWISLGVRWR